ncbi:molybdenum cofactor sulfurase 3 [Microplitis demolitor]|uniref:molybdenum cofactor sulfurase 3 n=1 Tax=Microplitis demolitor TaxID=69319 RepID=UPI0004CDB8D5|nr:molybdenum cofactor sulfurase 3 [Microplitis demolitor]
MEQFLNYSEVYEKKIIDQFNNEFNSKECYLDHAGATLYSKTQIKFIYQDLSTSLYTNPHSAAGSANQCQDIIERTRYRILDWFKASEDYSLVFTSGATVSLKCVAESFEFNYGKFVHLQDNHTSVLGMRDVVAKKNISVECMTRDEAFAVFSSAESNKKLNSDYENNSLFVYSAQCNFSGYKYPLEWIEKVHRGALDRDGNSNWFVLVDAAAFVGTNLLDLSLYKPDFVVLSFYKMFGYPTGLGALIVRNSSVGTLKKIYYGGGTVNMALSTKNYHVKKDSFHDRFEDGTASFLSIISLQHGLNTLSKIPIQQISLHVFSLVRYLHHNLISLHHSNGNPVVKMYSDSDYEDQHQQGGILALNILKATGDYVGYMEVLHMASLFKIHLRTGCFCNPGACQRHLNLTNDDIISNYDAGYTCGGGKDLIDGRPTGAVRISFGYMSTLSDAQTFIEMVHKCFIDFPVIIKIPSEIIINKNKINNRVNENSNGKWNAGVDGLDKELQVDVINKIDRVIIPKKNKVMKLEKIFIYPIKSCGAYEIKHKWIINNKGLKYDREWMIVTGAGVCLTQKQEVKLCLLKPTFDIEENVMRLDYPGMPTVEIPLEIDGLEEAAEICKSRVCGHRVEGIYCGDKVSEWLSLVLGRPNLKLIRQNSDGGELSFSSQAQYLLINRTSVRWLIDQIPEDSDCDKKTILNRFRGNFIVDGADAFEEIDWRRIVIGKTFFEVTGQCTRCQMVCIDQDTSLKTIEPLKIIADKFNGKMKFGIYLNRKVINKLEYIRVGDDILSIS